VSETSGLNERRKLFAYGMLGNVVEWYEFGVYGYLAGTIGAAFFPHADETVQRIAAFAVFGVGFVMRPVGSIVFGRIGDRAGRGRALLRRNGEIAELPLRDLCMGWRREAGAIMAILCLQATVFFIIFVLLPTYLSAGDGLLSRRLGANVVAMCLLCLSIPIFGRLSDQMGRVRPHRIGAWTFLALAVPLVLLARDGGFAGLLGAQAVFAILLALIAAPMPAMMAEAFPSQLRYTSVAIAYNVAISLFGGLAPVAVMTLSAVEPNLPWPGLLIAAAAALTLLGLRAMPEARVMNRRS